MRGQNVRDRERQARGALGAGYCFVPDFDVRVVGEKGPHGVWVVAQDAQCAGERSGVCAGKTEDEDTHGLFAVRWG